MPPSIGEILSQARQARKLSLEQAAQQTHIRLRYLSALEQEDFDALPSATQARGFLRTYAQFLKLDPAPLLARLSGIEAEDVLPAKETAVPPAENPHAARAEAILAEVGAKLRQQRELLGLSLEDVERHTHIRAHYLQALESGVLSDLPSPVQGRGMLSNYAIFLGCDPEPLLLRFAEGLQAKLAARQAAQAATKPVKARKRSRQAGGLRRFFSIDLLAGGFLVVFIIGFVLWAVTRISLFKSDHTPTPTSPSVAEVLAPNTVTPELSPQPGSELSPSPATTELSQTPSTPEPSVEGTKLPLPVEQIQTSPTSTLPPFDASSVQVYVVVHQRGWVRVTVDGQIELEGRVLPGSAYLFSGNNLIMILTGNAAALQVYFNQQDQGVLGQFGEVVLRAYSPSGLVQPTLTPTAVPTLTLQPTTTPTPTPTPTPLP